MDRARTSDESERRAYALARLKRSFIQRRAHKARVRQTQREYDLERRRAKHATVARVDHAELWLMKAQEASRGSKEEARRALAEWEGILGVEAEERRMVRCIQNWGEL